MSGGGAFSIWRFIDSLSSGHTVRPISPFRHKTSHNLHQRWRFETLRLNRQKRFCYVLVATVKQVGKVGSVVDLFLITDIASDELLIVDRRGHKISPRPKMIAFIAAFTCVLVGHGDRRLALQKAHNMGHRVLQRDRYQHVYMVGHQAAFLIPATLLSSKSMQQVA